MLTAHNPPPAGSIARSLAPAAALLGACALLLGCGHAQSPAKHSRHQAAVTAASSTTASGVAGATLAFLFPTNGADVELGSQVLNFAGALQVKAVDQCLASRALPPEEPPPADEYAYGAPQMPYMAAIRANDSLGLTIGVRAPPPPTTGMSSAEQVAYDAAAARCNTTAAPRWVFGSSSADSLRNAWQNIVARVASTPAMQASLKSSSACSASTPFPATTVGGEWAAIGQKVTNEIVHRNLAAANQTQHQGVGVLLRCFGRSIQLQGSLLASRRAVFLAANALAVREIQMNTASQIAQVGRRFHRAYRGK